MRQKNTRKPWLVPVIVLASVLIVALGAFGVLVGTHTICIFHGWEEATCEAPKTCRYCGKTEGEALGHIWVEATCEAPKTCSRCGATEGEALGHDWEEETCLTPRTCKRCGMTEGEAPGHTPIWTDVIPATLIEPGTHTGVCAICGAEIPEEEYTKVPEIYPTGFNFGVWEFISYVNEKMADTGVQIDTAEDSANGWKAGGDTTVFYVLYDVAQREADADSGNVGWVAFTTDKDENIYQIAVMGTDQAMTFRYAGLMASYITDAFDASACVDGLTNDGSYDSCSLHLEYESTNDSYWVTYLIPKFDTGDTAAQ